MTSEFDLAAHIVALTPPDDRVSDASFEALRSTVLSAPLDRSRPLWQIFLVPQLEDGRVGMVGKIHHALVDGLAALQIVSLILDPEPDVASQPPVPWQPRGRPGRVGWALDAVTRTFADGVGALRAGATAATHPPATVADAVRGAGRVLGAAAEEVLSPAPPSALNGPIGARRTLVGYHAGRDELRAARRVGGTLNDVGLAAVAGAVRALLQHGGERPPPEPLKAMVPVSMRRFGDTSRRQPDLHDHDRAARSPGLRHRAAGLGARADQAPQSTPTGPSARTSSTRRRACCRRRCDRRRPRRWQHRGSSTSPSHSRPPREGRSTSSGARLEEVYSVVPIAQGHALAIGMVRYRQELFFGCYADPDALPEVHQLPALIEAELQELGRATRARAGEARVCPRMSRCGGALRRLARRPHAHSLEFPRPVGQGWASGSRPAESRPRRAPAAA